MKSSHRTQFSIFWFRFEFMPSHFRFYFHWMVVLTWRMLNVQMFNKIGSWPLPFIRVNGSWQLQNHTFTLFCDLDWMQWRISILNLPFEAVRWKQSWARLPVTLNPVSVDTRKYYFFTKTSPWSQRDTRWNKKIDTKVVVTATSPSRADTLELAGILYLFGFYHTVLIADLFMLESWPGTVMTR